MNEKYYNITEEQVIAFVETCPVCINKVKSKKEHNMLKTNMVASKDRYDIIRNNDSNKFTLILNDLSQYDLDYFEKVANDYFERVIDSHTTSNTENEPGIVFTTTETDLTVPETDMKMAKEINDKYFSTKGLVLASGSNEFGQCGLGEGIYQRYYADTIPGLLNAGVIKVVAGGQSSYALNEQGEVLSWGCYDNGCLGKILSDDQYAPIQVVGFVPSGLEVAKKLRKHQYDFRMIRSARSTDPNAILSIDGQIYLNPQVDPSVMKTFDESIVDLDAGDIHCIALSDTGRVYTFGAFKCTEGAFVHDEFPADDFRHHPDAEQRKEYSKHPIWGIAFWPIHVFQLPGQAVSVAATCSSNCAIVLEPEGDTTMTSKLYTWGMGECGELSRPVSVKPKKEKQEIHDILVARGLDPEKDKLPSHEQYNLDVIQREYMVPKPVEFADGVTNREIIKVTGGSYHILVLAKGQDDKVAVYASGLNNYGQLGLGHSDNVEKLTEVSYFLSY